MEIVYNYITADRCFKVALPIEFSLLFTIPSEAKYHRAQILKYRLKVYHLKSNRACYRPLHINPITNRVFFKYKSYSSLLNSPVYFLDELIEIK